MIRKTGKVVALMLTICIAWAPAATMTGTAAASSARAGDVVSENESKIAKEENTASSEDGIQTDENSWDQAVRDALEKADTYGEYVQNGDTGGLVYDDPSLTLSKKIGVSSGDSRFDLREKGLVTDAKDQGKYNFCWAFATIASIESNLLKKGQAAAGIDLSEAHLAFFNFNGSNSYSLSRYAGADSFVDLRKGFSNYLSSAATLARRYGAVDESYMPYSNYGQSRYNNDSNRARHSYVLDNMEMIQTSQSTSSLDRNGIENVKSMLVNNGAVAGVMYMPGSYEYMAAFGATEESDMKNYYYPSASRYDFNHGVTIVGWDDNYPKTNFYTKPKGNGAWLVKNSYGSSFGDNGYFWASYYNPSISLFSSFTAEKNDGRDIYQYDGIGVGDQQLYYDQKTTAANTYKARKDMLLDRVGTWTSTADSKVYVKILVNSGSSPATGVKVYSGSKSFKHSGYHTIDLSKKIGIPKGMKFSVLVTIKNKDGSYYLPFEVRDMSSNDTKMAPRKNRQSYVKSGSSKWVDANSTGFISANGGVYAIYNALAKAMSKNAGKLSQKIKVKTKRTMKRGAKLKLKAKRTKGNGKLTYIVSGSKVSVSTKGIVKAKKKGTVKITVYAAPTAKCKAAKKVVKVKIK